MINRTCIFPNNLSFSKEFPRLPNSGHTPMYSLLNRIGISIPFYDDINELESGIFNRINDFAQKEQTKIELEEIFHLIQVWGGITGRFIYIKDGGFKKNICLNSYQKLVKSCLEQTISSRPMLVSSIADFDRANRNIGISFITKHTRFWLYNSLGENTLPIFDSIISTNLFNKKPSLHLLLPYWDCMLEKSIQEGISLLSLERQLFTYFVGK